MRSSEILRIDPHPYRTVQHRHRASSRLLGETSQSLIPQACRALGLRQGSVVSVLAERLRAQQLAGRRARDPLAVVERLLAVQAQDGRGARLAIRARSTRLSQRDIDKALTEDRSLLITWLNRGTFHLVRSEDYPWLQALTAPRLRTTNARRQRPRRARGGSD